MKPLENVKIIDFTIAHAGTLATMLLAAFGAEVIKIESVGKGDPGRKLPPYDENGNSGYFAFLNRGKKAVSVDITKPQGREIIKRLAADADVIVENFKDDYLSGNGLGYDELKAVNPRIIYAMLTGYGRNSPKEGMAALEVQIQSMCGISSISGYADSEPVRAGTNVGCHVSGTYLATAISLALVHAQKTGRGQQIDIAMLDSLFAIIEGAATEYTLLGIERKRTGNAYPSICPYDTFSTKNGSISIGVSTDRQWQVFCEALNLRELAEDPRYITNEDRGINYWTGLRGVIQERLSNYTKEEISELMTLNRIPCGIIKTVAEAMKSEQVRERNMLITTENYEMPGIVMPGIPIKINDIDENDLVHAPVHGQDTKMYLRSIGFSDEEIARLLKERYAEAE